MLHEICKLVVNITFNQRGCLISVQYTDNSPSVKSEHYWPRHVPTST